jgi:hypothetical protein
MDEDYAAIDRRLAFEHQRYNTEYMRFLERKVGFHEKMILGLMVVLIMFTVTIAQHEFRLGRIDETLVSQPSTHT